MQVGGGKLLPSPVFFPALMRVQLYSPVCCVFLFAPSNGGVSKAECLQQSKLTKQGHAAAAAAVRGPGAAGSGAWEARGRSGFQSSSFSTAHAPSLRQPPPLAAAPPVAPELPLPVAPALPPPVLLPSPLASALTTMDTGDDSSSGEEEVIESSQLPASKP